MQDMEWCQRYAFENRAKMLSSMVECVEEVTGRTPDMAKAINIHHNYCSCERCRYKVGPEAARFMLPWALCGSIGACSSVLPGCVLSGGANTSSGCYWPSVLPCGASMQAVWPQQHWSINHAGLLWRRTPARARSWTRSFGCAFVDF